MKGLFDGGNSERLFVLKRFQHNLPNTSLVQRFWQQVKSRFEPFICLMEC